MKTVAQMWDMIKSLNGASVDAQIATGGEITRELWEGFNAARDIADLRAYVGTVEEERNQARADLCAADEVGGEALARADALEAALLVVLKERAAR